MGEPSRDNSISNGVGRDARGVSSFVGADGGEHTKSGTYAVDSSTGKVSSGEACNSSKDARSVRNAVEPSREKSISGIVGKGSSKGATSFSSCSVGASDGSKDANSARIVMETSRAKDISSAVGNGSGKGASSVTSHVGDGRGKYAKSVGSAAGASSMENSGAENVSSGVGNGRSKSGRFTSSFVATASGDHAISVSSATAASSGKNTKTVVGTDFSKQAANGKDVSRALGTDGDTKAKGREGTKGKSPEGFASAEDIMDLNSMEGMEGVEVTSAIGVIRAASGTTPSPARPGNAAVSGAEAPDLPTMRVGARGISLKRRLGGTPTFCEAVREEIRDYRAEVLQSTGGMHEPAVEEQHCCRLCPYRPLEDASSLIGHLDAHHGPKKHPLRNFLRTAQQVWDDVSHMAGPWELDEENQVTCTPLARTAELVREWNKELDTIAVTEYAFKTLITTGGARLLHVSHPAWQSGVTRSSNRISMTDEFVKNTASYAILHQGRAVQVRSRLVGDASRSAMELGLAKGIPKEQAIRKLIYGIGMGDSIQQKTHKMRCNVGKLRNEMSDLKIDATVNCLQAAVGNLPEGKQGRREKGQLSRCISIKGRTGTLLTLRTAPSEKAEFQIEALREACPEELRSTVHTIASDNPPILLSVFAQLQEIFPNLECIIEDWVHIKIRCEKVSGGKRNQVSTLMHKAGAHFFHVPRRDEGENYHTEGGENVRIAKASYEENKGICKTEALAVMKGLSQRGGCPKEFGIVVAAIRKIGEADLHKRDGKGKRARTLEQILESQLSHYSWFRNNCIRQKEMTKEERAEASAGTATNEAVHKEVGAFMSNIFKQDMGLIWAKLRLIVFAKLSASMLRLFHSTPLTQQEVLVDVSTMLRNEKRIAIKVWEAGEYNLEQKRRTAASKREKVYRILEKHRRQRILKKRGVIFEGARRVEESRAFRKAARQRTFKKRNCGFFGAGTATSATSAAVRGKKWRKENAGRKKMLAPIRAFRQIPADFPRMTVTTAPVARASPSKNEAAISATAGRNRPGPGGQMQATEAKCVCVLEPARRQSEEPERKRRKVQTCSGSPCPTEPSTPQKGALEKAERKKDAERSRRYREKKKHASIPTRPATRSKEERAEETRKKKNARQASYRKRKAVMIPIYLSTEGYPCKIESSQSLPMIRGSWRALCNIGLVYSRVR